jgi:hypothetical protein
MYMYLGLLFSSSLLLSALLQRGNLQCGAMDGFRMGLFLVVVICIFFGCFRVVYTTGYPDPTWPNDYPDYAPCIAIGSTDSSQQLLSKTTTRIVGVASGGEEDEAKGDDNQSI